MQISSIRRTGSYSGSSAPSGPTRSRRVRIAMAAAIRLGDGAVDRGVK
jgi:hypothetical protein